MSRMARLIATLRRSPPPATLTDIRDELQKLNTTLTNIYNIMREAEKRMDRRKPR